MGIGGDAVVCMQDTDMVGHAEHGLVLPAELIGPFSRNHDSFSCGNDQRVFRHCEIDCLLAIRRIVRCHWAAGSLPNDKTAIILKWQAIECAGVMTRAKIAGMKAVLC